mgnify:CR=1 FL=1
MDITLEAEGNGTDTTTSGTGGTTTGNPTVTPTPTPAPTTAANTGTVIPPLSGTVPGTLLTDGTTQAASSTNTSGSTGSTDVISSTRKMYVESPEGAEVYIDGIYTGIVPVSFAKPDKGSHVITLSQNGHVTKSYTIAVSDDDRDVTLSFSELVSE